MLLVNRRQLTELALKQLAILADLHHNLAQRGNNHCADFAVLQFAYGFIIGLALETDIAFLYEKGIDKLKQEFNLDQSIVDVIKLAHTEQCTWICIDQDAAPLPGLPTYEEI